MHPHFQKLTENSEYWLLVRWFGIMDKKKESQDILTLLIVGTQPLCVLRLNALPQLTLELKFYTEISSFLHDRV